MVFSMLAATMASYCFDTYNASASTAGIVAGAFILGSLLVRFFSAPMLTHFGRKRCLVWSLVGMTVASLLYFVSMDIVPFTVVRFVHGMCLGVVSTVLNVCASCAIPRSRYGEGMSTFSISAVLAFAVGPFLGLLIIQHVTYTALFNFSTSLALVSLFCTIGLRVVEPESLGKKDSADAPRKKTSFFDFASVPLALLVALLCVCYNSVSCFINTYTTNLGLEALAPWFFIIYTVVLTVTRPAMGKLIDRKGDNVVVYPMLCSFILGLLLFSQCNAPWMVVVSAVLIAMGYGCSYSTLQTAVMRKATNDNVDAVTSTFWIFGDAGQGFGPAIMGLVAPIAGLQGMYIFAACVVGVILVSYFCIHGRSAGKIAPKAQK